MTLETIDGPTVKCDFETWECTSHTALAGGFDEHHRWPKTMGGPENTADKLILCPTHHRRAHALVRAYCEADSSTVSTVRWFSTLEKSTARYAYEQWINSGRPKIYWSSPAAEIRR